MTYPLFSIITVTLNSGSALSETIESLDSQTYKNFEHLIKDGCSTDRSLERSTVRDATYKRKIVIMPDRGIYDAMNQAVREAEGKYLLFLNSGDILSRCDVLEKIAIICKNEEAPELVYCNYSNKYDGIVVRSPRKIGSMFLYRTMLCHQTCFIKRDAFNELGGFCLDYKIEADYEFLLRLLVQKRANYEYVPIHGVIFMGGGVSADPKMFKKMDGEVKCIREKYFPGSLGLIYKILYLGTLPTVRIALGRSNRLQILSRAYQHIRNIIRRD